MNRLLAALTCFLAVWMALSSLQSAHALPQDETRQEEEPLLKAITSKGVSLTVYGKNMHSFVEGDSRVILVRSGVHVVYDQTRIWADNLVLWQDYTGTRRLLDAMEGKEFKYDYETPGFSTQPHDSVTALGQEEPPIWSGEPAELYAEGNVRISNPEGTFFCHQLYTHMAENRGIILSGEYFGTQDIFEKTNPIHFKAAMIKQVCSEFYTMEDVSFTTCICGVPHYRLKMKRAELQGTPQTGLMTTDGTSFEAAGLSMPLPDSTIRMGRSWYFPVKSIQGGNSSRFGTHVIVVLEEDLSPIGDPIHEALGIDRSFKGDVSLELGFLEDRGLGLGPTFEYEAKELYKGYTTGYYINDSADEDQGGYPIDNNKRGRIRSQNRVELGQGNLLDLELSYISDRHFLDEYFENEFKTDKEQETYLYLHKAEGSQAYSLFNSYRLNDFQTQNEYLPQGIWELNSIPIRRGDGPTEPGMFRSSGIFYNQRVEMSQVRNRPDDDTLDPSERNFRSDYIGSFEAPLKVGILKVTPFAENRFSYFERDVNGSNSTGRVAESYGARAGLLFHNSSGYQNDLLNINGMRNILEPSVEYRDTYAINEEGDELIQYDDMEDVYRGEQVNLTLRQRLQTRDIRKDNNVHTLYDGFLNVPFYPDRRLGIDDHRMGDMGFDLAFKPLFYSRPFKNMVVRERGKFDITDKSFQKINSIMLLNPDDDLSMRTWHYWTRSNQNYLGNSYRLLLTNKWEAEVGIQYNLHDSRWADKMMIIRRRAHQWLFEFKFEVDKGDDDTSFTVSIAPLALMGQGNKGSIYDPMIGN